MGGHLVNSAGEGVRCPLGSAGCLPLLFLVLGCSGSVSQSTSGGGSVSGRFGRRRSVAPSSFGAVRLLSLRIVASGLRDSRRLCDERSAHAISRLAIPPKLTFRTGFFPARLALRSNPPQKPFFSFCCCCSMACRAAGVVAGTERGRQTPSPCSPRQACHTASISSRGAAHQVVFKLPAVVATGHPRVRAREEPDRSVPFGFPLQRVQ